jgi:PAS domain S-box-containing protein
MKSPLRILYLEDDARDVELVQETLSADGINCQVTRVETEADFTRSLEQGGFDLVLADYTLPSFDGLSALKIARRGWPQVPLIFVSGTLGEEVAIEALKIGATDYVFKTRLSRLLPSVKRALREAEEHIDLSRTEEALRRSEAYLAEAQKLSHTGSFGLDILSGKIYWSQETFRIFEYEPPTEPTLELVLHRTHPEDRQKVRQEIDSFSQEKKDFDFEHRLLMPNGSVKFLRVMGRPTEDGSSKFEFVGAVTDISDRKRAEEELHQKEASLHEAQTELAHVSRLTTMGELAASIAHEVNQPLAAVVNNGSACLRWLAAQKLEEARQSAALVVAEGHRAGEIIGRIRALAKKTPPQKDWLDLNETIDEVIAMAGSEVQRNRVSLQTELANDLPLILGDKIQLQQVILNLLINAIEAMAGAGEGPRELRVSSEKVSEFSARGPSALQTGELGRGTLAHKDLAEVEWTHVLTAVRDSGPGLDPKSLDRLFKAFHTTKPKGLGMGLAISRSIIEAHGGRLWVKANTPRGAVFQFVLPIHEERLS